MASDNKVQEMEVDSTQAPPTTTVSGPFSTMSTAGIGLSGGSQGDNSSSSLTSPLYNGSGEAPQQQQQQQQHGNSKPSPDGKIPDKSTILAVLSFLKKHNLSDTENILKREAMLSDADIRGLPSDVDVQTALSSYASEENPDEYTDAYSQLKSYIDNSLDNYKYEVGQILWPVFVHMYLELVYNEHEAQAQAFFVRFSKMQETFHETDLIALGSITKKAHLMNSENPFRPLTQGISSSKPGSSSGLYVVRMSREALSLLKRFLQEKRLKLIQNIMQDRIFVDVYDGMPRGKAAVHAVAGYLLGEPLRQDNKAKVYYGLLREPDLQNVQMDEDDDEGGGDSQNPPSTPGGGGGGQSSQKSDSGQSAQGTPGGPSDKSKKKKSKKDWLMSKKGKSDPNAPPVNRMPLPELRDIEKIEKAKALREAAKRVTLGPERLPSICFYTILNGDQQVTCIKWSEDGTLMAVGFASSAIKIWAVNNTKLKKLKGASELSEIERESDDVLVRMMDDRTGETTRTLRGHSGPVYSLDFSPDKTNIISSSEDATIRLWSLLTWTCLVVYKGHLFPVWKVVFSPHGGYYFASAGHDRSARLWTTDSYQPCRVFAGHYSDVTAILFHPNSNYIATGSADRSVRVWDCVSGSCVRLMTGHKGTVHALAFSNCGRFLISGGADTKILIWDLANGGLVTILGQHTECIYTLTFSREGSLLASGGLDYCVRLWDFHKLTEDVISEEGGASIAPDSKKISGDHALAGAFHTKNTSTFALHFTRRNILLAAGPYQHV